MANGCKSGGVLTRSIMMRLTCHEAALHSVACINGGSVLYGLLAGSQARHAGMQLGLSFWARAAVAKTTIDAGSCTGHVSLERTLSCSPKAPQLPRQSKAHWEDYKICT